MAELEACAECGSTQRVYGICDCPLYPEVDIMQLDEDGSFYTRHVARMTTERLHSKSDIAAQLGARDREIDLLQSEVRGADGLRQRAELNLLRRSSELKAEIRTLRAKLMRERAKWLERDGKALVFSYHKRGAARGADLLLRARRLRAKAERVERGAP